MIFNFHSFTLNKYETVEVPGIFDEKLKRPVAYKLKMSKFCCLCSTAISSRQGHTSENSLNNCIYLNTYMQLFSILVYFISFLFSALIPWNTPYSLSIIEFNKFPFLSVKNYKSNRATLIQEKRAGSTGVIRFHRKPLFPKSLKLC